MKKILCACLLLAFSALTQAQTQINVVGLFNGKAVVVINGGAPKTLSAGQTSQGVKLLSANSTTANFLVEGKTKQLGMGQAASIGGGVSDAAQSTTLYADMQGHYMGDCRINGAQLKFVLDTGATMVALNSGDAKYANIDYKRGEPMQVSTANGVVTAYRVTLATLTLGNITLHQVEAGVLEGGFPSTVLLGMTALKRLEMKRDELSMKLTKKY